MRSEKRDAARKIAVKSSSRPDKLLYRTFPGPRGADAVLRVAIERGANAELVAHAKESLDAEVCGVLVGQFCEDDEGPFVHVEAIVRGTAASHGATHVTFTQATWDAIHATLEQDYPKSRIVGWYHTHPGFGVEFSEMDLFIQRNFFPGPCQIALVTDPLSGAVAIAVNTPDGIAYLPRFWVDAREQQAKVPAASVPARSRPAASPAAAAGDVAATVQMLEDRVSQLIQALDDQRTLFQRFLYTVGFVVALSLFTAVGWFIYSSYFSRLEPPKLNSYVPVPIRLGDKTVLVGLQVVQWDVPPEIDAAVLEFAKARAAEERKALKETDKSPPGTSGAKPHSP